MFIDALGSLVIQGFDKVQDFLSLLNKTLKAAITPPFRFNDWTHQIYFVANKSVVIVAFCVSFAAVVTIIEASFHMKLVIKNDSLVPGFASLLILRELGAVLAALLLTSRVGAGMAAEVGTMKITEQIDAYKMLGMEPIRFLVVPRFWACVIGGAILSIFANITCLVGAMIVSSYKLGYTPELFIMSMKAFVGFQDLIFATIKGAVFGAIIPLVSCYFGFRCEAGAEGVGKATTNSVVYSSIGIICFDFIMAWLFSHFY